MFCHHQCFVTTNAGGRDNAKMVTKGLLQALSMPAKDGNFFLRPDRIVGAFFLSANAPPVGRFEAKAALALEREEDVAAKERINSLQREMSRWCDQLQETNKELRRRNRSEDGAVGCDSDGADATNLGDIELHRRNPIRPRKQRGIENLFPDTYDLGQEASSDAAGIDDVELQSLLCLGSPETLHQGRMLAPAPAALLRMEQLNTRKRGAST
jgi:hypothetical protein